MQGQALPGFRDFYPEELALRNYIFAAWRDVARRYGFQEYDGPPLEPLELYTGKSGEEIVQQLYAFQDKGERQVVAAGEMLGVLSALDKWGDEPALTERRLQQALGDSPERKASVHAFLSLLGEEDPATVERLLASPAAERLRDCRARLEAMGLGDFVQVDFRIVRGLAYYTGLVFELFDAKRSLRAICGGGRYDSLIQEIAGVDLPCVGFGMGDVVLGELLKEHGKAAEAPSRLDAFLIAVGGEDLAPVLQRARELADRGIAVEYALRDAPIGKQLELAVARGAPRAVIVGPDERTAKVAVVRDLKSGRQRKVAMTKVRKGVFK